MTVARARRVILIPLLGGICVPELGDLVSSGESSRRNGPCERLLRQRRNCESRLKSGALYRVHTGFGVGIVWWGDSAGGGRNQLPSVGETRGRHRAGTGQAQGLPLPDRLRGNTVGQRCCWGRLSTAASQSRALWGRGELQGNCRGTAVGGGMRGQVGEETMLARHVAGEE